ncbi:hypothetical protein [Lentzea sp. NPDC004782]|uniref:hypothetical protein n=1 Tax=Lentzea sp. NPDC004782 TaxID=3154458 RepID=UPI0033B27E4E
MGELWWSDVREWFDPSDAYLHDGCVVGAGRGGRAAVDGLVQARGWRSEVLMGGTLAVWPAEGFQVNFLLVEGEDLDFDIDVRELQGQDRVDLLGAFLRAVGQAFGRPVALAFEGLDPRNVPYLHYDSKADDFVLDRES